MRLRHEREIAACWTGGKRRRSRFIDVAWRATESGHPRIGIVVPRYRHTAVDRNRLRRRLRELLRRRVLGSLGSVDLVIRARPEAYRAALPELSRELETLTSCA